jgi:phosphoribosylformimino-5-aminoimidazole carboxamide ribotide isomerase
MILFPAIDLKGGACVRLFKGRMAEATVYNEDPAAQARAFEAAGARWLHIVDLDGAIAGRPVNEAAVRAILVAVAIPVQLGGGIRDLARIEGWLSAGVRRVILGTAGLRDPALLREACRRFPGRVLLGIDARAGKVAVEGWVETSATEATALARSFEDAGLTAIIYTDIERDGALEGPNLAATEALARAVKTPIIASGGISSLADLEALKALEPAGVIGAVCGRALYDGRVALPAALELFGR